MFSFLDAVFFFHLIFLADFVCFRFEAFFSSISFASANLAKHMYVLFCFSYLKLLF